MQMQGPAAELVGLSKSDLIACAGAPIRDSQATDREYLHYRVRSNTAGNVLALGDPRIPTPVVAWSGQSYNLLVVIKDGVVEQAMLSASSEAASHARTLRSVLSKCASTDKP